ncbi:beta-N-acetylhexosaminidase [Halalkalibacillus halophilus]|uniref:beta-N-acetylhexosaminidase n=1 Tax=Halalkalibacillus halophilus TaxID=392827 RepID=UPI00042A066C|nr:beta-N-acetylhexosaminidase [Halalkalibacillus halophilus]
MSELELRRMVGQMIVAGFEVDHPAEIPESIKDLIEKDFVGNIILFTRNIGSIRQVKQLTYELQKTASEAGHEQPLWIATDQENGIVKRVHKGITELPGAMLIGATGDTSNAYETGVITGEELLSLGVNWNMAPVADVNNNSNNPVIGVRSYGKNPHHVKFYANQMAEGLKQSNVLATYKHFPGHGDTSSDSHLGIPVVNHSIEHLEKTELVPFSYAITNGAEAIMVSHVHYDAFDGESETPATLSKSIIKNFLRKKLEFDGLVVTDCMEMDAISKTVGTPKGASLSIQAGADLITISHKTDVQKEAIEMILSDLNKGELSESNIEESYQRIKQVKARYLDWKTTLNSNQSLEESSLNSKKHQNIAKKIYQSGVTIIGQEQALPLKVDAEVRTLLIIPKEMSKTMAEDGFDQLATFVEKVKFFEPSVEVVSHQKAQSNTCMDYDRYIIITSSAVQDEEQQTLIHQLNNQFTSIIAIAVKSPYDLHILPEVDLFVATYEASVSALEMAASALYGYVEAKGKLPI